MDLGKFEEEPMAAEKQESGIRSLISEARGGEGSAQATEALDGLRSVVEQASQAVRDLTQASKQWTQTAQDRAREMGQELRSQGERALNGVSQQAQELRNQGEQAVAGVSKQVEQNPLTSLAIAFGLGYLLATLTRR
jgi:ElaB/YqjD/DUF883 family membrane-anchored ribosome-binding protein